MKHLILTDKTTFKEAIELLDRNGNGFLAIVDDNNKLIGILTDGDIRRAVLNNKNNLMGIINKTPYTARNNTPKKSIILNLRQLHKKHMPLVDENGILQEIISLDDEKFNLKANWVVIMAGGLGSRLGELTKEIPKPMLEVNGKSILQKQIEMFRDQGFVNFLISVNYKSEVIKDYFQNGDTFGVNIKYLEEKQRLGTAGALKLIKMKIDNAFFVINGDIITNIDFNTLLIQHTTDKSDATMCIKNYENRIEYGVIKLNNQKEIVSMEEKPVQEFFINAGMYMFNKSVLKEIPTDVYFDMNVLFEKLIRKKYKVSSMLLKDYWLDIGVKTDYIKANEYIDDKEI